MLTKLKETISNNKNVFQNLSYLSLLQLFNLLVPLVTYPYLIRVLGAETYGLVIFAQAVVGYFVIIVNFGFNISATREISIHRNNKERIGEIVSSVFMIKGILMIGSIILFSIVLYFIPEGNNNKLLFYLTLYLILYEWLFPTWYFQGIERMKYITILNLISRSVFLVLIFVLIKNENDFIFYPVINGIGVIIASLIALIIIFFDHKIELVFPKLNALIYIFKQSIPIFISNISAKIYASSNKVIIGFFLGMTEVAYYDLAEKLVNILRLPQGILTQVLFPKISKDRNINFVKKAFKISLVINILGYLLFLLLLKPIIVFLGGDSMLPAFPVVVILGLTAPLIVVTTVFGTQLLLPFGYNKEFSIAIISSAIFYFFVIAAIYLSFGFSILNIALATVATIIFESIYLFHYCIKFNLWKINYGKIKK